MGQRIFKPFESLCAQIIKHLQVETFVPLTTRYQVGLVNHTVLLYKAIYVEC